MLDTNNNRHPSPKNTYETRSDTVVFSNCPGYQAFLRRSEKCYLYLTFYWKKFLKIQKMKNSRRYHY